MKTIGLICEFNPFHHGHEWLLSAIRQKFGEDATVVAIMSGNFVQRGEPAVFEKQTRARAALAGGCDLVLELPFPGAVGAAERFAGTAVSVLVALGGIDILAFGSECGDLSAITSLAEELESPHFRDAYAQFPHDNAVGGAKKTEIVYEAVYGKNARLGLLRRPNDVLAVEYVRALLRFESTIQPFTFLRRGAAHGEISLPANAPITSATEARRLISQGKEARATVLKRLPCFASTLFESDISAGKFVADQKAWMNLLLLHCRMTSIEELRAADGLGGGLADRIYQATGKARDGEEFFSAIRTKKYTDAFLRRALLAAFFGITKDELNAKPSYTQILGMTNRGRSFLARVRKITKISLLTKPADYRLLPPLSRSAAARAMRADAAYASLLAVPIAPSEFLRRSPCQMTSNDFPSPTLDKQ